MFDSSTPQMLLGLAAIVGAVTVLWKPVRKAAHLVRAIAQFTEDWNGAPERVDKSGKVIENARAGVPALLETVRNQVQNSHSTNLRDDVDSLTQKLDEHIEIAKESDRRQEETAIKVDQLAEDVSILRGKFAPHK